MFVVREVSVPVLLASGLRLCMCWSLGSAISKLAATTLIYYVSYVQISKRTWILRTYAYL
jgi:hypothetical protein